MPIRIIHQVIITISDDLAEPQKDIVFTRDPDLAKQTIDTYTKEHGGNFNIADTVTESLDLGDIDSPAKGLYLEASQECSVRLSGSSDPIVLRLPPTPQTGAKVKLFVEGDITAVTVEASEGVAVSGRYHLWGAGTT